MSINKSIKCKYCGANEFYNRKIHEIHSTINQYHPYIFDNTKEIIICNECQSKIGYIDDNHNIVIE